MLRILSFLLLFSVSAQATATLPERAKSVAYLLRELKGVSVRVIDDQITISGTVSAVEQMDRVVRLQEMYPDALNLVKLHEAAPDPEP